MALKNFSGGGSGTGRPATGDAKAAKTIANGGGSPAKMGGSGSGMKEVGIKASGGMSSVPSAASPSMTRNVPQSAYYSERGSCPEIEQGEAGSPKGYYGDRDGR